MIFLPIESLLRKRDIEFIFSKNVFCIRPCEQFFLYTTLETVFFCIRPWELVYAQDKVQCTQPSQYWLPHAHNTHAHTSKHTTHFYTYITNIWGVSKNHALMVRVQKNHYLSFKCYLKCWRNGKEVSRRRSKIFSLITPL